MSVIMRKVVFVTGNPLKAEEVVAIFPGVIVVSMELDELQGTPEEIVVAKARLALEQLIAKGHLSPGEVDFADTHVLVDDVSMFIECLSELPGPYIKPFFAQLKNKGMAELVSKYENQRARAQCLFGVIRAGDVDEPESRVVLCPGVVGGVIVSKPRGPERFGWDCIFLPDGHAETFAEMPIETKNAISHRALALAEVSRHLSTVV